MSFSSSGHVMDLAARSSLPDLVTALKSAGEPTRLRVLALLAQGEATVKDLTEVLAQSQPRVSRHLKLLTEAGLIERLPEGAWAYYRLAEEGEGAAIARTILAQLDPDEPMLGRDRLRLEAIKAAHAAAAQAYFARNAASWDKLRSLHAPEAAVEAAVREAIGTAPVHNLLDIGTGTGRMLTVLADRYTRGVGVDMSHDMLSVARANLAAAGIDHAHVRQGDITALTVGASAFDLVLVHQVLHYLDDPARALREAARAVAPGGRLLIVDFAPHDMEFLRTDHAHRRLGFSHDQVKAWIEAAGLDLSAVRDLTVDGSPKAKLTVTLWMARDRRIEMAKAAALLKTA
ncbi:ArsR/SmtB family transcription factor [Chthonobacter albigriseus]|uniref:ArsR/SmtB family transcription factor n=1 Tax=Chthonobacter albigriseus TaxID=1683161 RepID=UPI001FCEBA51|nr:metalloregulator ArsR/SmtB family transcription factor [Chthonobacter albigriseus]